MAQEDILKDIEKNINQAISDFDNIKAAMEEKGCAVPVGTDTSEYGDIIRTIGADEYEKGYTDGYNKAESVNPLYYAKTLEFAFTNATFKENSEIICKVLNNVRWGTAFSKTSGIKTLKIICDTQGLTFNLYALVRECKNLELLDLSEVKGYINNIGYFMYGTPTLKTILGELDLSQCPNISAFTNAFVANRSLLEEIRFVPNTIKFSIDFRYMQYLSDVSIQSILDGLADLTSSATQTLYLHTSVKGKLTEEQLLTVYSKNWNLG